MKSKSIRIINDITEHMSNQFKLYVKKYKVENCRMIIYPYNGEIDDSARCVSDVAVTVLKSFCDDDDITRDIESTIYVPTENIFKTLIDLNLDYKSCTEYYDMIILHEIGHVVYARNTFIGKPHSYFDEVDLLNDKIKSNIRKIRQNASIQSRINYLKEYFSLPVEKAANECVGITIDDIIRMESKLLIN